MLIFRASLLTFSKKHTLISSLMTRQLISTSSILNRRKQTAPALVTQENVKEYIYKMSPNERDVFLQELVVFKEKEKDEKYPVQPPTFKQLQLMFMVEFLPFIGFGFCDNFIMIMSGGYIETKLGVTLGITTMVAAGLGNCLSDVVGIWATYYIEKLVTLFGVHLPNLTPGQTMMRSTRVAINLGRCFGVVIGCLLGMFPLYFRSECPKEEPSSSSS